LFLRLVVDLQLPRCHLRGQDHTEAGASASSVTNLNPAAVCQHDGPADGQSEPVAWHFRLLRRPHAEEWLEYALTILGRYAWPLVLYRELQFAVVSYPSRDTDRGGRWRIFDRVVNQVGEQALYLTGVHPN